MIDKHDGVFGAHRVGELDGEMAGGDAVAGSELDAFLDAFSVKQRPVLTAEIFDKPRSVGSKQREMLAGKTRIIGITKLIRA